MLLLFLRGNEFIIIVVWNVTGWWSKRILITEMLNFNVMGPSFTSLIVLEVLARSFMLIKIRLDWTWVAVKSF